MKRNAFIDNGKLILVTLVVFVHLIQPFTDDKTYVYAVYMWTHIFLMPVFILLTGFFAKGKSDKAFLMNLVKKLLIPYFIFQTLYTAYYFMIGKSGWLTESLFYPHWALWFLVSLFCWHILLIGFKRLKPAYGILLAFAIGIAVGYIDQIGHLFSLSRTFVFFPFFLIGHHLTEEHFKMVKRQKVKIAGFMILGFVLIGLAILPEIPIGWLLQSKSYDTLNAGLFGGLGRMAVYLVAVPMTIGILAWIPQERFRFTYLGERTLYVYLLHGFIVQLFRQFDLLYVQTPFDLFALLILSIGIVFVLSTNVVMAIWQPVIELRARLLKGRLQSKANNQKMV